MTTTTHTIRQRRPQLPPIVPVLLAIGTIVALTMLLVPIARHPTRVAALVARTPPARLPVPVAGVSAARLSNTWGAARSGGRRHEGIDIFARRNTPVRSTTDGIVTSTSPNALGGTVIYVLGPGGHRHYYAHLERHGRFSEGDWVRAGDTIGYVGNTGNARTTPPHLHYGIYTGAGPINPYPLLSRAAASSSKKTVRGAKKTSPSKRAAGRRKSKPARTRDARSR